MPKTEPTPYDDPLVAEMIDGPAVAKFKRVQHLRGAAALVDQAMTTQDPSQKAKLEKIYELMMKLATEEAETAPVRVIIGETTVWPDNADCYTVDDAPPELRRLLAGRTVGTRGRIEHYDGDRYNLVEAYEVTANGVSMTERRAA